MGGANIETRLKFLKHQRRAQVLAIHRPVSIKPDREERPKIPGRQLLAAAVCPAEANMMKVRLMSRTESSYDRDRKIEWELYII